MRYSEWKREWFKDNFINPFYDWIYIPDGDKIISYHRDSGIEVQMSNDYWREFSISTYLKSIAVKTIDQKLDRILEILEEDK